MLYNFQLMKYIGEDGVAAFGVISYVNFICIGISRLLHRQCSTIISKMRFIDNEHFDGKLSSSVSLMLAVWNMGVCRCILCNTEKEMNR